MNQLIKAIMDAKGLTSSHFADEIGVPRPIVSHVLAGRNKPSLDMIQKIARRFPELGTQWILDESVLPEGITLPEEPVATPISTLPPVTPEPVPVATPQPTPVMTYHTPPPSYTPPAPPQPPITPPVPSMPFAAAMSSPAAAFLATAPAVKRIAKILVIYTDKTFDEYIQNPE